MDLNSTFLFNFEKDTDLYYNLLKEEDFNFKTKDISLNILKVDDLIKVELSSNSVLELKIGTNALIKSLEIINKTLNV